MTDTALSKASEWRLCDLYRTTPMSLRDLAAVFGLSHEGVRRVLQRNDIPLNPPGKGLKKAKPVKPAESGHD